MPALPSPAQPSLPPPPSSPPPQLFSHLLSSDKLYSLDIARLLRRLRPLFSSSHPSLLHHLALLSAILEAHTALPALQPPPSRPLPLSEIVSALHSRLVRLAPAYRAYCSPAGWAGAGRWSLDPSLAAHSALSAALLSLPWPASLPLPPNPIFPSAPYSSQDQLILDSEGRPHPSLTVLFALPFARLVYYRRLYQSFLNFVQPGSQDHALLSQDSNQLSLLLDLGFQQWSVSPLPPSLPPPQPPPPPPPPVHHHHHHQLSPLSPHTPPSSPFSPPTFSALPMPTHPSHRLLGSSSGSHSLKNYPLHPLHPSAPPIHTHEPCPSQQAPHIPPLSPIRKLSLKDPCIPQAAPPDQRRHNSPHPAIQVGPNIWVQQAILDLQRDLDTSRCRDLFTLLPKPCKLQLAPPTLSHSRFIRFRLQASFKTHPQPGSSTKVMSWTGQLALITDLLMFFEYPASNSPSNQALFLVFPPIASNHLCVGASPLDHNEFEVVVMGQEAVRVSVQSRQERDMCVKALEAAIDFGHSCLTPHHNNTNAPNHPLKLDTRTRPCPSPSHSNSHNPRACATPISPLSPPNHSKLHSPNARPPQNPAPFMPSPSLSGPSIDHRPSLAFPRRRYNSVDRSMSDSRALVAPPQTMPPHHPPFNNLTPLGPVPLNGAHHPHQKITNSVSFSDVHTHQIPHQVSPPAPVVSGRATRTLRKAPSAHALGAYAPPSNLRCQPPPPMPHGGPPSLAPFQSALSPSAWKDGRGLPAPRNSEGLMSPPGSSGFPQSTASCDSASSSDRQFRPPSAAIMSNHARSMPASRLGARPDEVRRSEDDESESERRVKEPAGPSKSVLAASMRTKVFLKQSHSQWKALGTAKLQVFIQNPGNLKQLVVMADDHHKAGGSAGGGKTLISTMVITDGVERVGRTGVAVDIGDQGARTGIVYMLQMKNEASAAGLFEQLLAGSDRRPVL